MTNLVQLRTGLGHLAPSTLARLPAAAAAELTALGEAVPMVRVRLHVAHGGLNAGETAAFPAAELAPLVAAGRATVVDHAAVPALAAALVAQLLAVARDRGPAKAFPAPADRMLRPGAYVTKLLGRFRRTARPLGG